MLPLWLVLSIIDHLYTHLFPAAHSIFASITMRAYALTTFAFLTVASTLSVIPGTGYLPASVRAACRSALAENIVGCSDELYTLPQWIPITSLNEICTSDCRGALAAMYTKATTACGTGGVNITSNGTSEILIPLNLAGELVWRFNATCLQGDGGFCKEKLQNMTETQFCSDCYMKKIQLDIDEPLDIIQDYTPDDFNSLKKSCGIPTTSYPIKPTTPGPTPTPEPECQKKVTGKAGDTINTIAKSNSVATDRLLSWNPSIPTSINDTLVGGEVICLDNVPQCLTRQVAQGDSCDSLVTLSGKGVDSVMFRSWNPTVGHNCLNLPSMIGKYVCIGPPGQTGPFVPIEGTPKPTISTTPISEPTYSWGTAPNVATQPMNFTTSWLLPTGTLPIPTLSSSHAPNDVLSAIKARISHCPFNNELEDEWDQGLPEEEYRLHSWDLSDECQGAWRPYCQPDPKASILPSPTTIGSTCYPTISTIVPEGGVKAPAPTNKGSPVDCNKWHVVGTGDNCAVVEAKYKINHATFRQYNPAINDACSNLVAQMAYCVRIWVPEPEITQSTAISTQTTRTSVSTVSRTSTSSGPPGPTESGTSATCTKWHVHKQGDTCDSIAAQYGIIVSRFRQLNRAVNAACSNLKVGNAYCVG